MKCRAQQDKLKFIDYKKSVIELWRQKGLRGIYQGWWITIIRDVPACGLWFYTYEALCRKFIKKDDSPKKKYAIKVVSGGLAGIMDWIPTYPFDVVKTKIQVDRGTKTPSIYETMKKYYKSQGFRFFFKGIVPTCLVVFPMNAITFIIYDEIIELLG